MSSKSRLKYEGFKMPRVPRSTDRMGMGGTDNNVREVDQWGWLALANCDAPRPGNQTGAPKQPVNKWIEGVPYEDGK